MIFSLSSFFSGLKLFVPGNLFLFLDIAELSVRKTTLPNKFVSKRRHRLDVPGIHFLRMASMTLKCKIVGVRYNPHDSNYYFLYCPSFSAAVLFSVPFGLTTMVHFIQAIYRKRFCWSLLWPEYGKLLVSSSAYWRYSTPHPLLVLLTPLWINAFLYFLMSRLVYFFVPEKHVGGINARRLSLCFVLLHITAFLVQAAGGSIIRSTTPSTALLGIHIYMGGIGLQQLFVFGFTGLVVRFHYKMMRLDGSTEWKRPLYFIYTLTLITIRIVFRLVEFSSGVYSPITMHEAPFYCLEALPMFVALLLWNISHPGKVLVGPKRRMPANQWIDLYFPISVETQDGDLFRSLFATLELLDSICAYCNLPSADPQWFEEKTKRRGAATAEQIESIERLGKAAYGIFAWGFCATSLMIINSVAGFATSAPFCRLVQFSCAKGGAIFFLDNVPHCNKPWLLGVFSRKFFSAYIGIYRIIYSHQMIAVHLNGSQRLTSRVLVIDNASGMNADPIIPAALAVQMA
ncbi:RTA1 like protein-domain-containing protein [Mycena sanguinolenta]|nr:RTA1 like protein-domain-containing protein [Mycena sanguinolenta]